jgi:Holliday junction resolvase RusA-like endonuclease
MHDTTTTDRPFAPPIETVLRLPPPLSVNKARRYDFSFSKTMKRWKERADAEILAAGGMRRYAKMPGPFEILIVVDANLCRIDLDNAAKGLIDYCKRLNLIIDDAPRYMRRVTLEWGHAPSGCTVTLRSLVA